MPLPAYVGKRTKRERYVADFDSTASMLNALTARSLDVGELDGFLARSRGGAYAVEWDDDALTRREAQTAAR